MVIFYGRRQHRASGGFPLCPCQRPYHRLDKPRRLSDCPDGRQRRNDKGGGGFGAAGNRDRNQLRILRTHPAAAGAIRAAAGMLGLNYPATATEHSIQPPLHPTAPHFIQPPPLHQAAPLHPELVEGCPLTPAAAPAQHPTPAPTVPPAEADNTRKPPPSPHYPYKATAPE